MKPGRELDALVAEKVFGWFGRDEIEVIEHYNRLTNEQWLEYPSLPHYSTDIAAAWQVVEKLQKNNPFWNNQEFESYAYFQLTPSTGIKGTGWYCNFGDDSTGEYSDTAPHAICLAALKVVGVEV